MPAVAVPVSLVATFIGLLASGFTINRLTLLALVLAIGLVVDDAVVILENIYRHIQMGEGRLAAALFGLFLTGQGLNLYSQIGMIMLVGLATKNGILIVEFANQLRDAGASFERAVLEASRKRLRPILMTAMPTAVGAIPLVLAAGAGSEARLVIGIVILSGIIVATAFTLYIIPCTYHMLARGTSSPRATTRELERQLKKV